ncbi:hypothetical protein LMG29739_02403 [Paraburkholderia solisilvae]|uniref:Uncharacterized protein n=1 Tax=Paraburkholderia solisilvae TaxID=624376 RepID=A0A6J5DSI6_9BURK|nr:hypothetical protein LMG29739_02403 [Paraburkholderia solisilvae]
MFSSGQKSKEGTAAQSTRSPNVVGAGKAKPYGRYAALVTLGLSVRCQNGTDI